MSKMFHENKIPQGESTSDMTLVRNRTETAKTVTEDGHVLGGFERAWVTSSDPVLLGHIATDVLRVVKGRYRASNRVDVYQAPPPQVFNRSNNENVNASPNKTNTPGRKRKPKK